MRNFLEKTVKIVMSAEKLVIMTFLPVMCIVIFVNTFSRYAGILTDELLWSEEFSRYVMIWMAFVAAATAMQEDAHYKMTAIVDACPKVLGTILRIAAKLVTVVFIVILIRIGFEMCAKLHVMGQTSPIMKLPMWIPYLAIPVSMALSVLHTVLREYFIIDDKIKARKGEVTK